MIDQSLNQVIERVKELFGKKGSDDLGVKIGNWDS
jgi:hypothetical protein